jgi:hypothetical protein
MIGLSLVSLVKEFSSLHSWRMNSIKSPVGLGCHYQYTWKGRSAATSRAISTFAVTGGKARGRSLTAERPENLIAEAQGGITDYTQFLTKTLRFLALPEP